MDPERVARAIIGVVELIFSKVFLRAIVMFVVFVFISGFFPWTKELYDDIFPQSELRIEQFPPQSATNQDAQLGNEWWYQRIAIIENRGNSTADQIYVSAKIPSGRITRYKVYSDFPYNIHPSTNPSEGYLLLTLEHLAPGANVTVYLWGARSIYSGDIEVSFSAVHTTGSSPKSTSLSSSDQIKATADKVITSFQNSILFIKQNEKVHNLVSGNGPQGAKFILPSIPSFLAITAFVIAFLAWLFLDSVKTALVHGAIASGTYWLSVDNFFIPPWTIMTVTVPVFLYFFLREGLVGFFVNRILSVVFKRGGGLGELALELTIDRDNWWRFALSSLVLVIGVLLQFGIWTTIHQTASFLAIGYIVAMLSLALL
jgi:hypothetical protein